MSSPKTLSPCHSPKLLTQRPYTMASSGTGSCSQPSTGKLQTDGLLQIQLCQAQPVPCAPTLFPGWSGSPLPDRHNEPEPQGLCRSLWTNFDWKRPGDAFGAPSRADCAQEASVGRQAVTSPVPSPQCMSAPCGSWGGSGMAVPAELWGQQPPAVWLVIFIWHSSLQTEHLSTA